MNKDTLAAFYRAELFERIMPFWMERALDREYGGYFNCFENAGGKLVGTDKFTWSQGRFTWVLSMLAAGMAGELPPGERARYLSAAASGAEFIERHCLVEGCRCAFMVDREGRKKEQEPGSGYETSIYADMFAVIGLAGYARAAGDARRLETALAIYDSVLERLESGRYATFPYPVPPGWRAHGIPMIALNTSQVMAEALAAAGHPAAGRVGARREAFRGETLGFVTGGRMMEFLGPRGLEADTMLGSFVNPGHCLEDTWFILGRGLEKGAGTDRIGEIADLAEAMFRLGWDEEHGGIMLYAHREGGRPRGRKMGGAASVMEEKLEANWSHKLWWVHSEALYTTLLLHSMTGRPAFLEMHEATREYAFRTFPDPEAGEWIQIRDRAGRPLEAVVALPVKDPFHIARNLVLILELLGA